MDFKEFLLLEDDGMIPRSDSEGRRPDDPKPPKRHPMINRIAALARGIKSIYTHARDQRKRTKAGTVVPITASTNITDPTLKRICELVSAAQVVSPGEPRSTKAAVSKRRLSRDLAITTSTQRERATGKSAGSGQKSALT